MSDKRIYLPDGNYKKLLDKLGLSRSTMDVCLKGFGGMKPETYSKVRDEAKKNFDGEYLYMVDGSRLFLSCQLVDGAMKEGMSESEVVRKCLKMIVRKMETASGTDGNGGEEAQPRMAENRDEEEPRMAEEKTAS